MEFKEFPGFSSLISNYLTDDQFQAMQSELILSPEKGDIIKDIRYRPSHQGRPPMKKKIPALKTQLEKALKDVKAYKAGKVKFRTTAVAKDGTRLTWLESGPEEKARKERLTLFKSLRADLGLSQSEIAHVLHVSTKSVQGWEIGNPIPEPILILTQLIHDFPEVRKRLLAA